jgi:uncharacterized protein (TIGR01777 family)
MRIVVAGGTGFLGQPLVSQLAERGDEVVVLTRRPDPSRAGMRVREVAWQPDGSADRSWAATIDGADAVVNLAGAGIADKRWTAARKRLLLDSRVLPTRSLAAAVRAATAPPGVFVQGSAVGFYGASLSNRICDESASPGDDFLGRTCVAWEAEAQPVATMGVRLAVVRTGIALAGDGGALAKMRLPFLLFVGGPVASGRQYFSWVHRDDWIAFIAWILDTRPASGPLNATAPNPVTNAELSNALGRALHRPSWLPVPGFALRIAVGELADDGLILGQRVIPTRALELGFRFEYPDIDSALARVFA